MKKSDLKTGMLAQTREGNFMVVMKDTPTGDNFVQPSLEDNEVGEWAQFKQYNENLTRTNEDEHLDIVKVYGYPSNMRACGVEIGVGMCTRDLLWERPPLKEFVFISRQTYVGESGEDVADSEDVIFDALTIDEAIATLKGMKHEDDR